MATARPKCNQIRCFQNKCGSRCELLTDYPSQQPCPFFKTDEQVELDRQNAHKKLADAGRYDLIEKYEYNSLRKGIW